MEYREGDLTHVWALLYTSWAGHELPLLDLVSGFLVHRAWLIKVCLLYPHPHPQPLWSMGIPMGSTRTHSHSSPFLSPPQPRVLHCKPGTMQICSPHRLTSDPFSEARVVLGTGRQYQHFLEQPRPTTSVIRLGPNPPTGLAAMDCGMLSATGSAAQAWRSQRDRTERSVFPGTNCTPGHGVSFVMNRPTVYGSSGPLVPNPR